MQHRTIFYSVKGFILLLFVFLCTNYIQAQHTLQLRTRAYTPVRNIEQFTLTAYSTYKLTVNTQERLYILLQWEQLPTAEQHNAIATADIRLLEYIPNNTYIASVPFSTPLATFRTLGITVIDSLQVQDKISPLLTQDTLPSWMWKEGNYIEVLAHYHRDIPSSQAESSIKQFARIIKHEELGSFFTVHVHRDSISALAALPAIWWIEEQQEPVIAENTPGRENHRASVLQAPTNISGRGLSGNSIRIGIWDGGNIGSHIDFKGRVTQVENTSYSDHATHCLGTAAGGGNMNPRNLGMAPGSLLFSWNFSGSVITEAQNGIANQQIHLATNSYGSTSVGSVYSSTARSLDILVRSNPTYSHIHSAGNSGSNFSTITANGNAKGSKNIVVVGALDNADVIASFSSRGPTADGRLKPEICGVGVSVSSTIDNNGYSSFSGTSMATPGVAGTIALLYQRHRQLFTNALPNSALIRGIVCNTAQDLGNPGPDYTYGYGRINARRAVEAMEQGRFTFDSVTQGQVKTHSFSAPAGVAQVRVMLTYIDKEGAASANPSLVNNLDLRLVRPSGDTILPWVLNPASPGNNATRGVDNINNIEQITLDTVPTGTYSIIVAGTTVPFGPQQYVVTWEVIQPGITIDVPFGGNFLVGTAEQIRWESSTTTSTFTVEFSANGGSTWTTISSGVGATLRQVSWTPQASHITSNGRLRISAGTMTTTSTVSFTVLGRPTISAITQQNSGLLIQYSSVSGAASYEIFRLTTTSMVSIGTTTATSFAVTGLQAGTTEWFSVRALHSGGGAGERSNAVSGIVPFPYTISGAITLQGSGSLSDIRVAIGSDTVTVEPNGTYLRYVNNGTYIVRPISGLHTFSPTSQTVTISSSSTSNVNFTATTLPFVQIGTGTGSNGAQAYPAPYGNYYWGARHQILVLASELTAAGLTPGSTLTSLGFDVAAVNSAPAHQGFRIFARNVTETTLTGTLTGMTEVRSAVSHQPTVGWNIHNFSTPFVWNGQNLAIEVCFNNTSFANNGNASTRFTTVSGFVPVRYFIADTSTVCGTALSTASQNRPNMLFGFVAPTGFSLSGTVSGSVQAGVTLTLTGATSATVTSNSNGAFSFQGLPNGSYTITPSFAGTVFAPTSRAVTINGSSVSGQDFTATALPAGYTVSGRITGSTQAGVVVFLAGPSGTVMDTTDSFGDFLFTGVTNGTYTLSPTGNNIIFTPSIRTITVNNAPLTGLDFTSAPAITAWNVEGTISGAIQANVLLTLSNATFTTTATSNGNGTFSLSNVPAGSYTLLPSASGFVFTPSQRTVVVNGSNVSGQDFSATLPTFSVSGTITGAAQANIAVTLSNSGFSSTVFTNSRGDYNFSNVPVGVYNLTPELSGFIFTPANRTISVLNNSLTSQNFVSSLPTYIISGVISGVTTANVRLVLQHGATADTLFTDASGEFEFGNLTNATYTLTPFVAGFQFTPSQRTININGTSQTGQNFTSSLIPDTLTVALVSGWNTVSTYVSSASMSMSSITSTATNVYLVKNDAGQSFVPAFSINQIGAWNIFDGYQIYTTGVDTLRFIGQKYNTEAIQLSAGWNLIPYLRTSAMDISSAISPILNKVLLVKNNEGQNFLPSFGINQIGTLTPGQGYWLYLTSSATLSYPANIRSIAEHISLTPSAERLPRLTQTSRSATLLIEAIGMQDGREIAVLTKSGTLVGTGRFQNGKAICTIWGEDEFSGKNGATEGETLTIALLQGDIYVPLALTNIHSLISENTFSEPVFTANDIIVAQLAMAERKQIIVAPNPATDMIGIQWEHNESSISSLRIIDIMGRTLILPSLPQQQAGQQSFRISVSALPSGLYFAEIRTTSGEVYMRPFTIQR